jgi:hypothetical protein
MEVNGGKATCGAGVDTPGGGGAIAIEYGGLDDSATLLDHLRVIGGTSTASTGGAGTVYVRGPSAILGALTVDNTGIAGNRHTVLPSLGRGIVQDGSSGGTVLTGRDTAIPAYFVGHWFEVEGQDRYVKGVWRIASIDGTTVTLEPKAGQPFTIAPGDRWRGIYRFDSVTVAPGSTLVSVDSIVQLVPPLPPDSVRAKAADDGSEALYGNDDSPVWNKALVSIATGSLPGSYRVTLAPDAVADNDGVAEVRLTSGGRYRALPWSAGGATFLWSGFPGQRLYLVALDAHARVQRAGWLELPPLPDGGWKALLRLPSGVTPQTATGTSEQVIVGDTGVWSIAADREPATLLSSTSADAAVALAADGNSVYAAFRDRLTLLDTGGATAMALPAIDGSLVDVTVGNGPLSALVETTSADGGSSLRLEQLTLPNGAPTWTTAAPAVPSLRQPHLLRTTGSLDVAGLDEDGNGEIYSWSLDGTGEIEDAPAVLSTLPGGWTDLGAWQQGVVLLADSGVRLVQHGDGGWTEVSRISLPIVPQSAAISGDRLVVLGAGEVLVYDVSDPSQPVLANTFPGSSFERVTPLPNGDVLIWSPPLAAPPLRWNPATAVPGDGFVTVIDGLP